MIAKLPRGERLEPRSIGCGLPHLFALEILTVVDSTNRYLMEKGRAGAPSGYACFAESQTAGRGRQGRPWISPKGDNLYFSLLWRFPGGLSLEGLAIAAGVAVAQALKSEGAEDITLKWPNDVLGAGRKLAGILVEAGKGFAVIGVGVNVHMPPKAGRVIDQPWIDMQSLTGERVPRNLLARRLLKGLLLASMRYQRRGLTPFLEPWSKLDALKGKSIALRCGTSVSDGVAQGIDKSGRLLLRKGDKLYAFRSGEVHVMAAS